MEGTTVTITSDNITLPDALSDASADARADTFSGTPGDSRAGDGGQPAQPQPLGSLLEPPAGVPGETPPIVTSQVVTCDGQDIVLIGPIIGPSIGAGNGTAGGTVEVLNDAGVPFARDRDTPAIRVTDPVRRENVLRRTLSRLNTRYRDASEALRSERQGQADFRSRLRAYAIDLLQDDDLDRDQLDDFLDRFDLPPYRPAFRVDFTITGSYVVIDSTPEAIRGDARGYLRPDLSRLDDVADEDTGDYTVTVDDVEQIDEID
jgi:hypothetical protein